ncbi:MAG TPA: DUF5317 domain-containing protein [Candidatus Limnocylindrales bacterium]|jgi:hypothetical protein
MFILYALVAGVLIGALGGGRLMRLADLRLHWAPLILGGFLVQVILFTDAVAARIGAAGPPLYVASTILVAVAVLRNVRVPGVPVIAVGAASNLAAILANGGYMPASPSALASLGKSAPVIYSNSAVVPAPALEWLTDRFALPVWVPFANVFSVGDVLLGVGVAILIASAMLGGTAGMRRPGARTQLPLSS